MKNRDIYRIISILAALGFIATVTIGLLASENSPAKSNGGKKIMPNIKEPLYQLDVELKNAEIILNGVPLIKTQGSVATTLPINLWIKNGANRFECRGVSCKADLLVADAATKNAVSEPVPAKLASFQFTKEKNYFDADISVPFKLWSWFEGKKIDSEEQAKKELLDAYRKVWQVLKNNDTTEVEKLFAEKIQDLSDAYYMSREEAKANAINIPKGFKLAPFLAGDSIAKKSEDLKLLVYGNGKLAKLVDQDGDSPVFFSNEDLNAYIDLMFYLSSAKGWTIIR